MSLLSHLDRCHVPDSSYRNSPPFLHRTLIAPFCTYKYKNSALVGAALSFFVPLSDFTVLVCATVLLQCPTLSAYLCTHAFYVILSSFVVLCCFYFAPWSCGACILINVYCTNCMWLKWPWKATWLELGSHHLVFKVYINCWLLHNGTVQQMAQPSVTSSPPFPRNSQVKTHLQNLIPKSKSLIRSQSRKPGVGRSDTNWVSELVKVRKQRVKHKRLKLKWTLRQ